MRDAALWPCLEVKEQALLVELAELLCLRTEARPDRDHDMGILLMHSIDHLLSIREGLADEVHGVPSVVAAPILPVLDDTIERNLKATVLVNHLEQLLLRLVAFAALPEAEGPEREHWHIARQLAHTSVHAIGILAVHEIIVGAIAHLGTECHALGIVLKIGTAVVVPVDAPAFHRLYDVLEVLQIGLLHMLGEPTAVETSVLHRAKSIDGLVPVERICLAYHEPPLVSALGARLKGDGFLLQKLLAVRCSKCH